MIRRVLIANRGEIARRIIRACRAMDIATVAVFSDADASAPHVREADAAEPIGPAAATASYLDIAAVVDAARRAGCDAVHPGYGFLSENAAFAEACEAAGLVFIGPPASVMRRMGSKTGARTTMQAAGVPVVPGVTPRSQSDADIVRAVQETGLPALLKAAAGGGGKGMRTVRSAGEIADAIGIARREAERAFGNGQLYVERLIEHARHVEVQIFGDRHGNIVHLFERDCTLQRRHQKVIEEAPAPGLTPVVRQRLTAAAIAAGRAVGYVNAGTVEFLLAGVGDTAEFYFLELNMRLQVEHPVTEAITGLDLVRAQIEVASGRPLPFTQADIVARGAAIECRVYAEDARTLLPQSGVLLRYRPPQREGIRVDDGVVAGQRITVHYDPMIAKLIAHAPTRAQAHARLREALGDYVILGLRHNIAFLQALLRRPELMSLQVHTRFIEDEIASLVPAPPEAAALAAAAVGAIVSDDSGPHGAAPAATGAATTIDPWDTIGPRTW